MCAASAGLTEAPLLPIALQVMEEARLHLGLSSASLQGHRSHLSKATCLGRGWGMSLGGFVTLSNAPRQQ